MSRPGKIIVISSDTELINDLKGFASSRGCELECQSGDLEDANSDDNVVPIRKNVFLPSGKTNVDLYLKSLDEVQSETIKQALSAAKGNVSRVSKILNIGRATLYRKIKQYDIDLGKSRTDLESEEKAKAA